MDITSKISINFSPVDAEALFKKAVMDYLQTQYGITTDIKNVDVKFKAAIGYPGPMELGPGTPEFTGVDVTIGQTPPAYRNVSCG